MNKKKIMYIGCYCIYDGKLIIKVPFEITHETEKLYYIGRSRYKKDEEGEVKHLSAITYPYLRVYFVDVENPEQKIKEAFCNWFKAVGESILKK